jgi:mannose-1-phosphate guanylyltransferase
MKNMKVVIFAGGIGTRMWPLSRVNSPKQFDTIFAGKSTLQLAFSRVAPVFGSENIYVQTTKVYRKIVERQLPKLPKKNIFIEPERRDVGPAVCFAAEKLKKIGYGGAMAIVWADHLMDRVDEFRNVLKTGEKLIELDPSRFVFVAERPRFANNNLGWIKIGKKKGEIGEIDFFSFGGWKYKPKKAVCDKMYKAGDHFWNPGYFITSVDFLLECYKTLAPEIYRAITDGKYAGAPKLSFDNAVIEKVDLKNAVVLKTNMGWSDPGTLYALKEALEESSEGNVEKGRVVSFETKDSLIYNLEKGKLVATVGLEGMVIVNTEDAIIVAHKDDVVRISDLVKEMKEKRMDKYL